MTTIKVIYFKDSTIWTTYTRGIAIKEYFAQILVSLHIDSNNFLINSNISM